MTFETNTERRRCSTLGSEVSGNTTSASNATLSGHSTPEQHHAGHHLCPDGESRVKSSSTYFIEVHAYRVRPTGSTITCTTATPGGGEETSFSTDTCLTGKDGRTNSGKIGRSTTSRRALASKKPQEPDESCSPYRNENQTSSTLIRKQGAQVLTPPNVERCFFHKPSYPRPQSHTPRYKHIITNKCTKPGKQRRAISAVSLSQTPLHHLSTCTSHSVWLT